MRDWREWTELRAASREFLEPWEPTWPEDALTRSAFRRRLRRQVRDGDEDRGYAFFVLQRQDDSLIGGVTLSNIQRGVSQSCNLGYWIGAAYARQGYMTEALNCVLSHCFGSLGLHRVEAACLPHNEASKRLLGRCGFNREGYAHEYLRIDGAWQDHLLFALLAPDHRLVQTGASAD